MAFNIEQQITDIIAREGWLRAKRIERTMKRNAPVYTGAVKRSIKAVKVGKRHWVIAPHTDHDYYAEYGNHANSADGMIHPTHARAMTIHGKSGKVVAIRKAVRPHKGSHFVEKTVSKYK